MPSVFKPKYEKCRAIIDCTEFRCEKPMGVAPKVHFYSNYKHGFRMKALVVCTPCGHICYISKAYGGRITDAQITIASEFLDKLEYGDLILADKGFPEIKTAIDEKGKNVLLVMPPFLENSEFTVEEVEETKNIASVRIHIERIMRRLRIFKINEYFTHNLSPFCDKIMFMCAVLVNLQAAIIKDD